MAGVEFGTVMRMVGQEVYLDTDGRQQPWVNESLRRLLYLGEAPKAGDPDKTEVLKERRQLLVHIADLPDAQRAAAKDLADGDKVPMSVVFAMMKAAGISTLREPAGSGTEAEVEAPGLRPDPAAARRAARSGSRRSSD